MKTPTITFTPNAEDTSIGKLYIPGVCSLEALYTNPKCPDFIKATLEKHIHWQMRCETPIHRGLNLKNQFMAFRAAMAVFGIGDIEEDEEVILPISHDPVGSALVRPTPSHTPIVGSFARMALDGSTIRECAIAIIGIEKRRLSKPDTQVLIGKELKDDTIEDFAKQVAGQYIGYNDFNGTAKYRKAMVAVTLQRALQEVKHG